MKLSTVTTYGSENDFVPCVYRCSDPIKNLKIKVRFQQPKTRNIPLPEFSSRENDNQQLDTKDDEPKTRNIPLPEFSSRENDNQQLDTKDDDPEFEERTFSWQEKVFSKSEVEFYRHSGNCQTPLHEQYHQEVSDWDDDTGHLFSYIDADEFREEVTVTTGQQICAPANGKLELVKKQSFVRRKPKMVQGDIVNYFPSVEIKKQNHYLQICEQVMYIMADLTNINRDTASAGATILPKEIVLCRLSWNRQHGLLTVKPDFSAKTVDGKCEPYLLEVGGDARNPCRYWLFHASDELDDSVKLPSLSLGISQMSLGTDFTTPNEGTRQTTVLVEILSASGFDYDGLFVEYCFDLPEGWSSPCPEKLSGVTHRSNMNDHGEAHFCHIFEIELMTFDDTEILCRCPHLLMRAMSLDTWGRSRVEGYCHISLPSTAGRHILSVPSWRFSPSGPFSEMRRFFVGGGCNTSMDIAGVPDSVKGRPVLGKFGLQSVSSGTVRLRLDVIHQVSKQTKGWEKGVPQHLSSAALLNSVEAVIAAFTRARHRMLRARQGLDVS